MSELYGNVNCVSQNFNKGQDEETVQIGILVLQIFVAVLQLLSALYYSDLWFLNFKNGSNIYLKILSTE